MAPRLSGSLRVISGGHSVTCIEFGSRRERGRDAHWALGAVHCVRGATGCLCDRLIQQASGGAEAAEDPGNGSVRSFGRCGHATGVSGDDLPSAALRDVRTR